MNPSAFSRWRENGVTVDLHLMSNDMNFDVAECPMDSTDGIGSSYERGFKKGREAAGVECSNSDRGGIKSDSVLYGSEYDRGFHAGRSWQMRWNRKRLYEQKRVED